MNIDQLRKRLMVLKVKGFVASKRKGPTGVGYTFENEFGLSESNIPIPDLGGRVEVKVSRLRSNSLITLFTFNKGVWRLKQKDLIKKFGYRDKNGRLSLYSTVCFEEANSQGLFLKVDESEKFVILIHSNGEELGRWKISHLISKFLGKMSTLLFVFAESRKDRGHEEFHYGEAYLCKDASDDRFIEAIKERSVYLDLRMHLKPGGTVRNHGTGFRAREDKLYELYEKREKLI